MEGKQTKEERERKVGKKAEKKGLTNVEEIRHLD